ncbi:PAS domain S-box protein, partial [Candidatus Bathyarchaeota archaeon]|nr:PAS domain S-box protein [Candidatus Bathyarchaeota archaeon]
MSLMKGESPSPFKVLYVRRDGTSRWAEVRPGLMIKDGNPVGNQAIMRDVTERKKAEEALRETKDYLDNLLNYANAPIIVWDNEQKITLFNNAFEALTGYKKESMLGRNIDFLFQPLQKTEILQTIERATRGEKWQSVEVPILCKNEETRIALWNSANIHDKDGNMVATIAQGQDITERKALEDALQDAKQKWTSLTENTDDIVMIVDTESVIRYINRTIPPHTAEGTIGKTVYEYVPREQHDTMRSSLKKTFETGVPLGYVVSSSIPKIGTIWFETKIVPVKDHEKTVSAILMSTDITELKNAEEALRKSEEKFRNLFDRANDAIMYLDRHGRILDVNGRTVEMFGGTREELIGKQFAKIGIFSIKETPMLMRNFADVLTGKKTRLTVSIKNKKGQEIALECSVSLVRTGELANIVVVARDMSERQKAEEELRNSEERLNILFELAPDAYYLNDLKGNFIDGNKAAEEVTGYTKKELIGESFLKLKLLPRSQALKAAKLLAMNALGKPTGPDEFVLNRKDG